MRLSRFTRSQIASHGGSQSGHIPGMNPRKYKMSASISGTHIKGPRIKSLSQHTAPYKHEMNRFGTGMGMELPEEDLPP